MLKALARSVGARFRLIRSFRHWQHSTTDGSEDIVLGTLFLEGISGVEWGAGWVVQVLHEQYFISGLVIDDFVDELAG